MVTDRHREQANRQAQAERLVELCDCPFGAHHGVLYFDSAGRLLRRGDHLVRGPLIATDCH